MSKVSVIVPVYNAEKYLKTCLDSLKNQSLQDIEIILVDDGSTDQSSIICDEYSKEDPRFRVIHQPNEGVAVARNVGVSAVTSPYVAFVDSDDYVDRDFCLASYNAAAENGADLVRFGHYRVNLDGSKSVHYPTMTGVVDGNEALADYVSSKCEDYLCVMMFKASLFENVTFPPSYYYEDIGTTYQLVMKAKKVVHLHQPLYYYCAHEGSITNTHDVKHRHDFRDMTLKQYSDLLPFFVRNLQNYRYVGVLEYALIYCMYFGRKNDDTRYKSARFLINELSDLNRYLPAKRKIMYYLYVMAPGLFDYICIKSGKRNW